MAKKKAKAVASPLPIEPLINPDFWTQLAFVLTLALVIARAMMMESVRDGTDAVIGGSVAPRSPGPASTLFLDSLCLLPSILVLVRRVLDRQYVIAANWSHALIAGLALWAALSIGWSTDKFLTLVSVSSTIASAALIWSTSQLVRSWLRLRIIAGVCLGLLLIYAAQGLTYRFLDVPDNIKFWQQNKEQILREHGWDENSFEARQFEKKLTGGEMIGFNSSPNSFAAVIVVLVIIATGLTIQRARDSVAWLIGIAVISLPILLVLYLTHARTALGTLALGTIALAFLASSRLRERLAARPRQLYWIGVAAFALVIAAIVGHGIAHGSLPQDSLNFRWRYWVASTRLLKQHLLTGVGWGNFGEAYLSVRLPIAAEEIRDPHNFPVRAFAELGIIGGMLVLAWLARSAWEITRPIVPSSTSSGKHSALLFAIAAVALGVVINIGVSIDFAQPTAFLTLEAFRRLLGLGLLSIGVLAAVVRVGSEEVVDTRPAPWLLYGLLVALGAFFVHTLMEFVLAEPGPLMLFSMLLGSAIGLRTPWNALQERRQNISVTPTLIAVSIGWLALIVMLVIPMAEAEQRARDGDDQIRAKRPDLAVPLLAAAHHAVPYNWDYAMRTARAMAFAGEKPEKVKAILDEAIAADPRSVVAHLTRAGAEMRVSNPDPNAVRVDYDSAIAIDPQNIQIRRDYADILEKFGDRKAAAAQLRAALAINAAYDPAEPKRVGPDEVKRMEERIAQLSS